MLSDAQKKSLLSELNFKTSRSGGKGGQHVNKVSSKVEVIFNLNDSEILTEDQKTLLQAVLYNKLDGSGCIHITAQADRSQLINKQTAVDKLLFLIEKSLVVQKQRKPTKIPKAIIKKRIENKVMNAHQKALRKKIDFRKYEN